MKGWTSKHIDQLQPGTTGKVPEQTLFPGMVSAKERNRYYIGIDPGTCVGLSLWDRQEKKLLVVASMGIIEAQVWFHMILKEEAGKNMFVRMEDARTWKPHRQNGKLKTGPERWMGAGSIRRDCNIWIEFFDTFRIPYELVPLGGRKTKMKADVFQKTTGWKDKTNEHARDSALLVYGL